MYAKKSVEGLFYTQNIMACDLNGIIEIAQQCPSISFMYLQVKGFCGLSAPDLG